LRSYGAKKCKHPVIYKHFIPTGLNGFPNFAKKQEVRPWLPKENINLGQAPASVVKLAQEKYTTGAQRFH